MAMRVLYYYDYFLTLPDEVPFTLYPFYSQFTVTQIKYAWTGRKTWSESVRHGALSVLTGPVFYVFILVSRFASIPYTF
jgi:hypothetical protein